jgi:class 3 adenylate cyclase/pimeloyl-ACP methyl ester carboxylesterase
VGEIPEVRFTRSGDVDLAYQLIGSGGIDIVLMIGWVSNLEVLWELAECRNFLQRLGRLGRVALFDKRGTGLSDRPSRLGSIEASVPDVLAVMDAAGMERAVMVGWIDAAAIALQCAARHPQRVAGLVLGEMPATMVPDAYHPWSPDAETLGRVASALEQGAWGEGLLLSRLAPSAAADERISAWFRKLERSSATPSMAAELLRRVLTVDSRPILHQIDVPALVVHRAEAAFAPRESLRWLADHLPQGRYLELPGDEVPGFLGDVDGLMDEIEDFLLGTRVTGSRDRRLLTVMFTDVVGSTEQVAALGARRWQGLLAELREQTRRSIASYGGREVDTAGDGFFITFDTPRPALQCATAVRRAGAGLGLRQRIGIHAGEVLAEGGSLTGMTVHIGARVCAAAPPDGILVSQTVRDVMVGSEFDFDTAGRHRLKGVPGEWELLRLRA